MASWSGSWRGLRRVIRQGRHHTSIHKRSYTFQSRHSITLSVMYFRLISVLDSSTNRHLQYPTRKRSRHPFCVPSLFDSLEAIMTFCEEWSSPSTHSLATTTYAGSSSISESSARMMECDGLCCCKTDMGGQITSNSEIQPLWFVDLLKVGML
jgi:hypothetical protein